MRILFVRTYCPNPIRYGSEMRSGRFVDYFREKGNVDLLTLTSPTELADENYIKGHFDNYFYFDQRGEHERLSASEKFRHLLPWQLAGHYAKDFQRQLNAIVEENKYDLIFVFKLQPVFYFLQLPRHWHKKIVVDFDDIISGLSYKQNKDRFIALKNSYFLNLYERRVLKNFKRVYVCSRDAVSTMPFWYRHKIDVVPNIFEADPADYLPMANDKGQLLYVGSLDYSPNIEGLKWFFDVVWPEVKKAIPSLKLDVVGKRQQNKDTDSLYSLFGNPKDVEITLNVPSVIPFYQKCYASVVPLLNGSGTRLKILESAAYGRPVLTTAKGMEGLDFEDKRNIFIFGNAGSFLKGYQTLLDKERYQETAMNALGALQRKYSINAFTANMDKSWQTIVNSNSENG